MLLHTIARQFYQDVPGTYAPKQAGWQLLHTEWVRW